jgi:hypothetical protein
MALRQGSTSNEASRAIAREAGQTVRVESSTPALQDSLQSERGKVIHDDEAFSDLDATNIGANNAEKKWSLWG